MRIFSILLKKKTILFIAPLPPPITGMANASRKILDRLDIKYKIICVNFTKKSFKQGFNSINRLLEIISIICRINKEKDKVDIVYLTLSQSIAGNIKDLIILFITRRKKQIIHLHGGGIRKTVYDKNILLRKLNKYILKNVDTAIVLSDSLKNLFQYLIPENRIVVVPNYSEDYLLLPKDDIRKKYNQKKIHILFLSNLLREKGYMELLCAAKILFKKYPNLFEVHFAGGFERMEHEKEFLKKIKDLYYVFYHGVVKEKKRIELYRSSQVFCLPTYYRYEGQPISIIEAYASGCVVVTTDQGGIGDIFINEKNGYEVEKESIEDLVDKLEKIILSDKNKSEEIGLYNNELIKNKYTETAYVSNIDVIFDKV